MLSAILALAVAFFAGFVDKFFLPVDVPTVDLGYARYRGTYDANANITSFQSIRFAASPTGNLRWRAPQRPQIVRGVQEANTPPVQCPQAAANISLPVPTYVGESSEDCLFLNVFVPGQRMPSGLPVVVFIHGGGYSEWNATVEPGSDLVKASKGSVLSVMIQYRLGIFGFLSGEKVKADGVLNTGLLDQQFALRWVQEHISIFGGDPQKVTIWGESAGAGSVLQHVIANDGNTQPPLFRGAISSSLYVPPQYYFNDPIPQRIYSRAVELAGCSNASDSLTCLRKADVSALAEANEILTGSGFYGTYVFTPVVDGYLINQRPRAALTSGKVNGQALLAVTNSDEGGLFTHINLTREYDVAGYIKALYPALSDEETSAGAHAYHGLGSTLDQFTAIYGESIFLCLTYGLLAAFSGRSYKGEFALEPAQHGFDIPYYFPSGGMGAPPFKDPAFTSSFSQAFLNFVVSLDPSGGPALGGAAPKWQLYNLFGREMVFNKTEADEADVRTVKTDEALLERCGYWKRVTSYTAQ